jgi:hypothetical protein
MSESVQAIIEELNTGASFTTVARKLNTTKGVVAGVCYRNREQLTPRFALLAARKNNSTYIEYKPLQFVDGRNGLCRFPLWSRNERIGLVCGQPVKDDLPYCAKCCAIAYVPTLDKKLKVVTNIKKQIW